MKSKHMTMLWRTDRQRMLEILAKARTLSNRHVPFDEPTIVRILAAWPNQLTIEEFKAKVSVLADDLPNPAGNKQTPTENPFRMQRRSLVAKLRNRGLIRYDPSRMRWQILPCAWQHKQTGSA